jgi:hypothetical protein
MIARELDVRWGSTTVSDEVAAVEELRAQVDQPDPSVVLFFCSARYDLPRLGTELVRAFPTALFGCTSAGQIGSRGYQRGGISVVSIASSSLHVTPHAIRPLGSVSWQAAEIGHSVRARRAAAPIGQNAFGLLLVDGLSLAEERVASSLHHALGGIPIVGGSAGDDLAFEATHVFADGAFQRDTALLLLFETTLPFRAFKTQHFVPTGKRMVITAANADRRIVTEINGKPAADEYARLIETPTAELSAEVFSRHPIMLQVGGDYYVRAIQQRGADASLSFFCAIEAGLVVHLGRAVDPIEATEAALGPVGDGAGIVFGCDCILRRIEFEQRGLDGRMGDLLARHRVFGFSTYGEQFNSLHVNQTFTGIRLGG